MRECIFLDRDGVIIENREDYIRSWEDVIFLPGTLSALARLANSRYAVIILTNQSLVGKGFISLSDLEIINKKIISIISAAGGRIDGICTCPHKPEDQCSCRKPRPGLFFQAAREHDIDLKHSFMVGDAWSDIEASIAAGCRPVLVLSGRGQEQLSLIPQDVRSNLPIFSVLPEVIEWLLTD